MKLINARFEKLKISRKDSKNFYCSFEPHEKTILHIKKQEDKKKSASTAYSKSWLAIVFIMMVVFSIIAHSYL